MFDAGAIAALICAGGLLTLGLAFWLARNEVAMKEQVARGMDTANGAAAQLRILGGTPSEGAGIPEEPEAQADVLKSLAEFVKGLAELAKSIAGLSKAVQMAIVATVIFAIAGAVVSNPFT